MNLRPLHDRVVVQRIDDSALPPGAIIVPDSAKEKPQRGTVIAAGTPAELKSRAGRDMIEVHVRDARAVDAAADALRRLDDEPSVDRATRRIAVAVGAGTDRLTDAVRLLDGLGIAVDDIALRRPTLDEVFLAVTGRPCAPDTESDPHRDAA